MATRSTPVRSSSSPADRLSCDRKKSMLRYVLRCRGCPMRATTVRLLTAAGVSAALMIPPGAAVAAPDVGHPDVGHPDVGVSDVGISAYHRQELVWAACPGVD